MILKTNKKLDVSWYLLKGKIKLILRSFTGVFEKCGINNKDKNKNLIA